VNYFNGVAPYTTGQGYAGGYYGNVIARPQVFNPLAVPLNADEGLPAELDRDLTPAPRTPTGHAVVFNNSAGYFGVGAGGGAGAGGRRPGAGQGQPQQQQPGAGRTGTSGRGRY
jgi:hypothetical protein